MYEKKTLSIEETQYWLNVSRSRVYELIRSGDLKQVSITGKRVITLASVQKIEAIALHSGKFEMGDAA